LRLRRFSALNGKINQNEVNYAKQTQFSKKSNVYNLIKNNELQLKIQIGHLVKTNPNEANSCLAEALAKADFTYGNQR
jgi:hypothetical protein